MSLLTIPALPAEISKWVILILAIGVVIFIIKAGMKIINIILTALLLLFCWFTFFTEEGAARLTIALKGKPITAYTTKLTRQDEMSSKDTTYFKSDKEIIVNGQKQEYVKCHTKWIIRIPSVEY